MRQGAKVRAELARAAGPCVQLTAAAVAAARRLQRIFFLHEGHDLSRFLARPHPAHACHVLGFHECTAPRVSSAQSWHGFFVCGRRA